MQGNPKEGEVVCGDKGWEVQPDSEHIGSVSSVLLLASYGMKRERVQYVDSWRQVVRAKNDQASDQSSGIRECLSAPVQLSDPFVEYCNVTHAATSQ